MMISRVLLCSCAKPIGRTAVSRVSVNVASPRLSVLSTSELLRRHYAAAASSSAGAKPRSSKAPSSALKEATRAKKPAKVKKPKKEAAALKLKSWEKLGPDGKLLPLPRATKPKRSSGFTIFLTQRAKELRNDPSIMGANNKFDVTKLAATVGQQWRSMSEADKKALHDQAQQANAQYERDLERWRNSLTSEDIKRENAYIQSQRRKGKSGTALLRDPTKPKQPRSAFLSFFLKYRQQDTELATLSIGEQSKRASTAWKQLSNDERARYEDDAAADRERYQQELGQWKNRALA